MAKKPKSKSVQPERNVRTPVDQKTGHPLQDMLDTGTLAKLKQMEQQIREVAEQKRRKAEEERRREQEERERNKSFAELLEEYEKKGGGKYS